MGTFDAVLRRLDAIAERARKTLPGMTRLPFLVMRGPWEEGKTPDYRDWQKMLHGESELTDWPGYEEQNASLRALPGGRVAGIVAPKLYLFDPEQEGIDDRPQSDEEGVDS